MLPSRHLLRAKDLVDGRYAEPLTVADLAVFNDPPTAQPYGIDTSLRDPSGNNIRLTQVMEFVADRAGEIGEGAVTGRPEFDTKGKG
ncbi:hypothetical protein [Frankia sp. EI5c]|uniref:hypothetical protein n=1 Tax=Frankia sp. EI5c TaxID=683316 RepID=UPI001F5BF95E|nr:hypothetical protein [Frankia sp. EI5c]